MFLATVALTFMRAIVAAIAAALKTTATGPLLVTPHVHLYTNDYTPQPTDALSAYTEATFAGYAAAALTLTGPVNTGPTTQALVGTVTFTSTADIVGGVNVTGYFVDDGATALQAAEKFAQAVQFVNTGDFLTLNVVIPIAEVVPIDG